MYTNKKVDTLIIGGGVTGISLAGFLNNKDYLIIEKDDTIGGYCRTTKRNGFTWDYSGHFFHFRNEKIKDYVLKNLDCDLLEIKKNCKIFYKNHLIDFPFQNNIHQLPFNEFIECLHDLSNTEEVKSSSFKESIENSLGKSIAEKFIIPYNEKLYKCDLDNLDVNAMGRFFPKKISSQELIENIRFNKKVGTYNDTFIYPIKGCFEFVKSLLKRVESRKVLTNTELLEIDVENKKVITNQGEIYYNRLINTTPFNLFYSKTTKKEYNFEYNKVGVFNLGFDRETNIDSSWIYFPNNEVFYRVGFYNNILGTKNMSLYVEISFTKDEQINQDELLNKVILDLKKCGIVGTHNLVDKEFLMLKPAYVHITESSNNLFKTWCDEFNQQNIYSIGRYGSWTYCSIEDNIIEAENISKILNF